MQQRREKNRETVLEKKFGELEPHHIFVVKKSSHPKDNTYTMIHKIKEKDGSWALPPAKPDPTGHPVPGLTSTITL